MAAVTAQAGREDDWSSCIALQLTSSTILTVLFSEIVCAFKILQSFDILQVFKTNGDRGVCAGDATASKKLFFPRHFSKSVGDEDTLLASWYFLLRPSEADFAGRHPAHLQKHCFQKENEVKSESHLGSDHSSNGVSSLKLDEESTLEGSGCSWSCWSFAQNCPTWTQDKLDLYPMAFEYFEHSMFYLQTPPHSSAG